MKTPHGIHRITRWLSIALVLGGAPLLLPASAGELPDAEAAEDPAFQPVAERRAEGIMEDLGIADADQRERVRRYVLNFIIRTKNIHEGSTVPKDEKRPALEEARATLYEGFDKLELNEAQRLTIKNGLSANYYRINYDAFVDLVPDLTAEEKAYIHEQLAEVLHEAMLLNSGSAKGEMFIKRRGRINNYLSDRGYDLKALSVARNERIRQARQE